MTFACNSGMEQGYRIYDHNGTKYADGLFRMHDEQGVPLTISLIACVKHNCRACLKQFVMDALHAGWSQDKTVRTIDTAIRESGYEDAEWTAYMASIA